MMHGQRNVKLSTNISLNSVIKSFLQSPESAVSINLPEEAVKRFHRQDKLNYLLDIKFIHLDNCTRINCTWKFQ